MRAFTFDGELNPGICVSFDPKLDCCVILLGEDTKVLSLAHPSPHVWEGKIFSCAVWRGKDGQISLREEKEKDERVRALVRVNCAGRRGFGGIDEDAGYYKTIKGHPTVLAKGMGKFFGENWWWDHLIILSEQDEISVKLGEVQELYHLFFQEGALKCALFRKPRLADLILDDQEAEEI